MSIFQVVFTETIQPNQYMNTGVWALFKPDAQVIPDSVIREIFDCGIRNLEKFFVWNPGPVPERQISANPGLMLYLPSYALLRVTFCVMITASQRKGSTVFSKLWLHVVDKKTVLKIWLNPGLNLAILRGTRSRALESKITRKESGIPLTISIQNRRSMVIRNQESMAWNPQSNTVLNYPTWSEILKFTS